MLAVQVQYLNLLENKRHNLVSEEQNYRTIDENKRHNLVTETQSGQSINETKRHNLEQERAAHKQAQASLGGAYASQLSAQANLMNAQTSAEKAKYENALKQAQTDVAKKELYVQATKGALNSAQSAQIKQDMDNAGWNIISNLLHGAGSAGKLFK